MPKQAPAVVTEEGCKNCGAGLSGHYCSACGQPDKHIDPSLHDLVHEFVHEFLHLDGKILATLKALVLRPGRLSAEFLAGRRARYIGPVRVYLTFSLLFFLVLAHSPGKVKVVGGDKGVAKEAAKQEAAKEKGKAEFHFGNGDNGQLRRGVIKTIDDPEVFKHAFLTNMSRVMFVIVPLFALGLKIAYRNRERRYPAFVYFSLHYHSFVFLVLTLYTLTGYIHVPVMGTVAGYAALLLVPGYLFMAMRRVFGGSRRTTALRMAALAAFYLPCLGLGLAVAAGIALFTI